MQNLTHLNTQKNKFRYILKLTVGALLLLASGYFIIHSAHFFKLTREELGKYFEMKWILILHISGGSLALLTGPFQFWEEFRNRNLKLHRGLGKVYVVSALISALCAVYLSFTSTYVVGVAYAFSAQVWVMVWLSSTVIAYWTVRLKKIKLHKEWMVRSYLVSLAFVMSALLLKLPVISQLGSFAEVSPGLFWVSWAVPLFVYDVYLTYQRKQ